jgi:micrococcal nuclease
MAPPFSSIYYKYMHYELHTITIIIMKRIIIIMYEYNAKVIRVYDGDTIWADLDLGFGIWMRNQSIRLLGINTPELRGESKEAGIVSRDRVIELLDSAGNECIIRTSKGKQTGKYGRILGEIWIPDQQTLSVNDILLNEGLAVEYMK